MCFSYSPALSNSSSYEFDANAQDRQYGFCFCAAHFITIPRFVANSRLCVATVLDEYTDRTSLRGEEQQLFNSFAKPHHVVFKDTISRWNGTDVPKAGIDTTVFKPHSTRPASTSKARSYNVPLLTVMKAVSCSSDCC